uniref:signal-recognition-particle GTPase n=1 Tax=Leersia perrieri TaxID=77586 RepID=A0A0D9WIG1_9ORYZ
MVLAQLGGRISRALTQMSKRWWTRRCSRSASTRSRGRWCSPTCSSRWVVSMASNIRKIVNLDALAAGTNKRRIIHQAVFTELCNMLDPGKPSFTPTKGKPTVVMFVGLQGSGKTTTCTKYASYYLQKGFKPSLVCADTFRAGAFDQLKQNATKAKIPYYGSYMESDPVKIAVEGVERFRKENSDLIIVDTSGRHKQEAALFEEMRQVAAATKPDLVIFVMDGSIGQAAFDQAQAFKQSASVGAVIVTKLDGHAKGGGALSAVAATKSPVIFIELENTSINLSRLLGMGDLAGLANKFQEAMLADQPELMQKLTEGTFTLQTILRTLLSMLPGFKSEPMPEGHDKESQAKIKRYMTIMDSMTDAELDSTNTKLMNESRINRIARGSGRLVKDVMDMLQEYKRIAKVWSKLRTKLPKNLDRVPTNTHNLDIFKNIIPPQLLNQMGGANALQNLVKQMGSKT